MVPASGRSIPGRVVFLGPTYMFPNKDAIEFFLGDIWPSVRATNPDASLHLIGKCRPEDKRRYEEHSGVTCLGYVSDVRPHLLEASCCIAPLRIGGGTRLKILDYWALGRPVVSTTIGAEGLVTEEGSNILLRDDAVGFGEAVRDVLMHHDLREKLARGARNTAEEHYSWNHIGAQLREEYRRLLT
jgi:glycosyltransferase involved in cell wall biosynthesis